MPRTQRLKGIKAMDAIESGRLNRALMALRQYGAHQIDLRICFADPLLSVRLPHQDRAVTIEDRECRTCRQLELLIETIEPLHLRGDTDHGLHGAGGIEQRRGKDNAWFCRHPAD